MKKISRIIMISHLLMLTFLFVQCAPQKSKNTNNNNQSATLGAQGSLTSLEAFEKTVYPLTSVNCAGCHNSAMVNPTKPYHADSKASTAHNEIINNSKVNLENPSDSRLYLRLASDSHYCWSNCDDNAAEMLEAIQNWQYLRAKEVQTFKYKVNNFSNLAEQLEQNGRILNTPDEFHTESIPFGALTSHGLFTSVPGDIPYFWVDPDDPNVLEEDNISAANSFAAGDYLTGSFYIDPDQFDENAQYHVYVFGRSVNGSQDRLRYSFNNSHINEDGTFTNSGIFGHNHGNSNMAFEWQDGADNVTDRLRANTNTITIFRRDRNFQVNSMVISTNPDYHTDNNTEGAQTAPVTAVTLAFPLDSLASGSGAVLKVDFSILDDNAYRLNFLRIKTDQPIVVRGIMPLINNRFDTKDSSYKFIDQTVLPGQQQILSNSSVIIQKDRGENRDILGFAFDYIGLAGDR